MAKSQDNSGETDSVLVLDSTEFFKNLLTADGSPRFPDMQISCEGETFEVQRSVLAAFSPVLNQLFVRNQQNNPGKPLDLPKEFVTKESFELILDLIYKGRITIDGDNVLRLHSAGNYLEIDQVVNKCADFIVKGLEIDSVISVFQYACTITASANRLLKGALKFSGGNFSKLAKHDTVLALEKGEFCELLSQLKNVDDENLVLEAALEWLVHDWKARFKDCEEVLSCVLWQFVDHTRCVQLKSVEAIKSKIDPKSPEEVSSMNTLFTKVCGTAEKEASPDSLGSNMYYLGDEKQVIYTLQKLCLSQQEPNPVPVVSKMEQQQIQPVKGYRFRSFFTFQGRLMTVLSNEDDTNFSQGLMLAGISENSEPKMLAQLEVLEMNSSSFTDVKITTHGGVLSIFFYYEKTFLLSTYDLCKFGRRFVYDDDELFVVPVSSRTVDKKATGNIALQSTLTFTSEVNFFGVSKAGSDSSTDAVDVNVFHVANQKWSKLPCLQTSRLYPTVEVIDRSFFVVGGKSGSTLVSNAVERMSIDDPTGWTTLPGLKYPRKVGHLISCGHFLIVLGGNDGADVVVEKAEILDLQNLAKGWEEYPPLHGVNPGLVVKA